MSGSGSENIQSERLRQNLCETTRHSRLSPRYRQKETAGWCAGQIDLGPMPAGYLEVSDCTKCHEDIGKHANEIDDQQEWYTTVTGLEKDGPFAFPLLVLTGNGRDGKGMINPAVEHLLEWNRRAGSCLPCSVFRRQFSDNRRNKTVIRVPIKEVLPGLLNLLRYGHGTFNG